MCDYWCEGGCFVLGFGCVVGGFICGFLCYRFRCY